MKDKSQTINISTIHSTEFLLEFTRVMKEEFALRGADIRIVEAFTDIHTILEVIQQNTVEEIVVSKTIN